MELSLQSPLHALQGVGETRALCDRIWDGPLAADEAYVPLRRAARERLEAEAARNTLN